MTPPWINHPSFLCDKPEAEADTQWDGPTSWYLPVIHLRFSFTLHETYLAYLTRCYGTVDVIFVFHFLFPMTHAVT